MVNYTTLVLSTFMLAGINLASAKLNQTNSQSDPLMKVDTVELSALRKDEKEKLKTYFDESIGLVQKMFAKYKAVVEKSGSESQKESIKTDETALNKEIKDFKDEMKYSEKHAWTTEQYYKFFSDCEARIPKFFKHVKNAKEIISSLYEEVKEDGNKTVKAGKDGLKREFEILEIQEKSTFQYPIIRDLVELSEKRVDDIPYNCKVSHGYTNTAAIKKNIADIKKKHDSIVAVNTYEEKDLKKVSDEYAEFETLVKDSKNKVLSLYNMAKKNLESQSKDSSMTFFEKHIDGFPNSSGAFLEAISSRMILITIALYAIANL
ncbi:BmGPI13, B microti specific [Babesia microti strain RI]|uniref:BmGPI13, B microti specific n=1 Tax=Babesia microti (strain RI) TaxID=1133968 RepID=A0A0K3AMG9_BABMR|nr:BmGPI13, B microti specific [Babesia microti strain RI]CTQ40757.1 BmGPI13, B microti specific [Babesia microti strain RI]|eukprot:XP_012648768.2 BmGPI13, B microti specific [Babesia microti strain RI]